MSNSELLILPFHVNHTLYRVYGLLRLEPGQLVLEFQSVENILGLIRGRIRTVRLPLRNLDAIQLEKGFWGGRNLSLRTRSLESLRKFPGAYQGLCSLHIRRADSLLAENLVSLVDLRLAEGRFEDLNPPSKVRALPFSDDKVEQLRQLWQGLKDLLR